MWLGFDFKNNSPSNINTSIIVKNYSLNAAIFCHYSNLFLKLKIAGYFMCLSLHRLKSNYVKLTFPTKLYQTISINCYQLSIILALKTDRSVLVSLTGSCLLLSRPWQRWPLYSSVGKDAQGRPERHIWNAHIWNIKPQRDRSPTLILFKWTELNSHNIKRDSSASYRCVFICVCTLFWNHYLLCHNSHLTEDQHAPDLGAFSVRRQSLLNLFCT